MTSPLDPSATAPVPALESGQHGFFLGFLYTTRDALLSPSRFYGALRPGVLALPFVFATVSLALPPIAYDIASHYVGGARPRVEQGALALLGSALSPLLVAALLVSATSLLWTLVTRVLGSARPLNLALRAMAYLTSLACCFGLLMTASENALVATPRVSAGLVVTSMAYLCATCATYRLARGPYELRALRAALTVWLFQLACVLAAVGAFVLFAVITSTFHIATRFDVHEY